MSNPVVVDGSNVAYEEHTKNEKPRVENITVMRDELRSYGFDPIIIIVDAALHHEVDAPRQLEKLLDRQEVRQAPADTDADYFVLQTAQDLDAVVVSNDRYQPYRKQIPWIRERRIPFMIIDDAVELYEPKLKHTT